MSYIQKYCKQCKGNRRCTVVDIAKEEAIAWIVIGCILPPLWLVLAWRYKSAPTTCDTCGGKSLSRALPDA